MGLLNNWMALIIEGILHKSSVELVTRRIYIEHKRTTHTRKSGNEENRVRERECVREVGGGNHGSCSAKCLYCGNGH